MAQMEQALVRYFEQSNKTLKAVDDRACKAANDNREFTRAEVTKLEAEVAALKQADASALALIEAGTDAEEFAEGMAKAIETVTRIAGELADAAAAEELAKCKADIESLSTTVNANVVDLNAVREAADKNRRDMAAAEGRLTAVEAEIVAIRNDATARSGEVNGRLDALESDGRNVLSAMDGVVARLESIEQNNWNAEAA